MVHSNWDIQTGTSIGTVKYSTVGLIEITEIEVVNQYVSTSGENNTRVRWPITATCDWHLR